MPPFCRYPSTLLPTYPLISPPFTHAFPPPYPTFPLLTFCSLSSAQLQGPSPWDRCCISLHHYVLPNLFKASPNLLDLLPQRKTSPYLHEKLLSGFAFEILQVQQKLSFPSYLWSPSLPPCHQRGQTPPAQSNKATLHDPLAMTLPIIPLSALQALIAWANPAGPQPPRPPKSQGILSSLIHLPQRPSPHF